MAQGISVEVENAQLISQKLAALQLKNPKMQRDMRMIMSEVVREARKDVLAKSKMQLPNDPRKAYKAVRSSVYKRIFGGQINILSRKKNNGKMYVGGSTKTRGRSKRTEQLMGYYGTDRGFILRFMNAGTEDRVAKTANGHTIKRQSADERNPKRHYKSGAIGFRGKLKRKDWFSGASEAALVKAAQHLEQLIDQAIIEVWDK